MAETPDDVRRDIELTRERMSTTLDQLERKLNVTQFVRDNPWPAVGIAVAAGFILSGSRADVKAAAATVAATRGASGRLGPVLDDLVSQVVSNVSDAFESRVTSWVDDIRDAIGTGAQHDGRGGHPRLAQRQSRERTTRFADMSDSDTTNFGTQPLSADRGDRGDRGGRADMGSRGGYGTGPMHTDASSFGNPAPGSGPTHPGTGGAPGFGGETGTGRAE